ncbi:MAG TPA: hypothetical protein VES38_09910 [Methylotenera sp.]|nr:hypothetical protein [Methylotenera sp.]
MADIKNVKTNAGQKDSNKGSQHARKDEPSKTMKDATKGSSTSKSSSSRMK